MTTKYCSDCRWSEIDNTVVFARCTAPQGRGANGDALVSPEATPYASPMFCNTQRSPYGLGKCGPRGRWWQAKTQVDAP